MTRVLGVAAALIAVGTACDDTVFEGAELGYEPTWLGMQVFMVEHCRECHSDGGVIEEVPLPEAIERDLCLPVDVEDGEIVCEVTAEYVVPGDPDASMLWRVVSGDVQSGDPGVMPLGRRLPIQQTEHVREWILAGAPL